MIISNQNNDKKIFYKFKTVINSNRSQFSLKDLKVIYLLLPTQISLRMISELQKNLTLEVKLHK